MQTKGIDLQTLVNRNCLIVLRGEASPIGDRYSFDHTLVAVEDFGVFYTMSNRGTVQFVPWENVDRILFDQDVSALRKTA